MIPASRSSGDQCSPGEHEWVDVTTVADCLDGWRQFMCIKCLTSATRSIVTPITPNKDEPK